MSAAASTPLGAGASDVTASANPFVDIVDLIRNFSRDDAVAKIKAAGTTIEAFETLAAMIFPGVAVAEIPTQAALSLAILVAELSEGKFSLLSFLPAGSLSDNAGEQQNEIIHDRFDR